LKALDRILQRQRIQQVKPYIIPGSRLLDIGCADGLLFKLLGDQLDGGIGIDPTLAEPVDLGKFQLLAGWFPQVLPVGATFDAITLLAVLEHIPRDSQPEFTRACIDLLNPGGRILITVPSPVVDLILAVLRFLRLIDGMSLEEHYGFDPSQVDQLFSGNGVILVKHKRFQFGVNNLFVFGRKADSDN
jgi:SAM-dependent methyltransferase